MMTIFHILLEDGSLDLGNDDTRSAGHGQPGGLQASEVKLTQALTSPVPGIAPVSLGPEEYHMFHLCLDAISRKDVHHV